MPIDFATEYSQRSSDELLHLASARHSLTTEAAAALDAELRRRNLIEADRVEYHTAPRDNPFLSSWQKTLLTFTTPGIR
jgi:hypothetical protein